MFRYLYAIVIFTLVALNASDKVEIYATSITSYNNIVEATDGVTVVYKDYYLSAKKATYNKDSGDLELFDNIKASYQKNYKILGNYARLNIVKKEKSFKPFYMLDSISNVWISAKNGVAKDKDIEIDSGILSGCNQNNPLWKMEFTSSNYDYETKWLDLYNTTLYIYDIPLFYMPYIGYSLDIRRKTGLLMPGVGISDSEGFYYQQPIYIAQYNEWDLEIKPQIRSNRGYGIYSDFRFVDSSISQGEFNVGYFKEFDRYVNKNNLVNKVHYGFNFTYENSDVINQWLNQNLEGQSGLYIDINNMNDVDYINLASNNSVDTNTAKQILSRINLFYNTDSNYIASYFKYYKDLEKKNNDNTLQQLPTLHYHHYLDTLLSDHLIYNIDMKSSNIQRIVNKTALQTDLYIPITLQTSLFDEYLNISYKANLYGQYSKFRSTELLPIVGVEYDNGYFARNYHTFSASTELTRAFENVTHVISFSSNYTMGGKELRDGYYEDYKDICLDPTQQFNPECDFYNILDIDEALELEFTQYLYDFSGKEIFYHRLAQRITYLEDKNKYGELENELDFKITDNLTLYNNMFYNFDENKFSKVFNQISFTTNDIELDFSHLYKDEFLEATTQYSPYTSYITSAARYNYNQHYSYRMRYDYDLEARIKKSIEVGFLYKKRCWDFGLRYVENNRPQLTQDRESSVYDKYIYITVVLRPLMKSGNRSADYGVKLPQ